MQNRILPLGIILRRDDAPRISLHLLQIVNPRPGFRLHFALHERPISLLHPPGFELFGNRASRFAVLGEHNHPRHRPIQPMGYAEIDIPFNIVPLPQKLLDPHFQAVDPQRRLRQ